MTYEEAIDHIRNTAAFGTKLGLDNIRTLMSYLGDPQDELRIIHIAGTNGKGSTAAFILSALSRAGYRTGFYTSPELTRFSERIKINDEEISHEDIARYTELVKNAADRMAEAGIGEPSEFELVLAMAFCYFRDRAADCVILETGLGGRLDATNVIKSSVLSVITKISFDHMQYLGHTLPEIAREKAAIIKPHGRVLVYPASPEITEVFEKAAGEAEASLSTALLPERKSLSLKDGQSFSLGGKTYKIGMAGLYETENASLAIQALDILKEEGFDISEEDIRNGLKEARWPARFEVLSEDPLLIADGAHNEDGAQALSGTLAACFGSDHVTLCMGILKDKEYDKMLSHLLPHASSVIACTVPNSRSLSAGELAERIHAIRPEIPVVCAKNLEEAVEEIKKPRPDAAASVICGSLYLAGPLRELLLNGD